MMSIRLRIEDTKKKDLRRNYVIIDPQIIKKTNIRKDDIVELIGKKKSVGIVKAGSSKDKGLGIIRVHLKYRKNLGKEIGETIEIRKTKVKIAKELTLIPFGIAFFELDKDERVRNILQNLQEDYPITLYDKLYISNPLLFQAIYTNYIVVSLIPNYVCIINKDTNIIILDDTTEDYYSKALNTYQYVIGLDPNDSDIWLSLGFIYRMNREYDKAEDAFSHVIKDAPENFMAWMSLGLVYNQKKAYKKAINAFKNALEYFPEEDHAKLSPIIPLMPLYPRKFRLLIRNLNYAIKHTESYNDAIKIYRDILHKYYNLKDVWNVLGEIYVKKSDYLNAIDAFKSSLKIDFNEAFPLESFFSFVGDSRYVPKILYLKKIHQDQFKLDSFNSWYYLATIYLDLEDYEEALNACEKCLEINPNSEDGLNLYKKILKFKK